MADGMALNPAVLSSIQNYLRQKRATGQIVQPDEIRKAYEGALTAETKTAMEQRRLDEQRRQYNETMEMQKKAYDDRRTAMMFSGLGSMALLGKELGLGGPLKKLWNKTPWGTPKTDTPAVPSPQAAAGTPSNMAQPAVGVTGAPSAVQPATLQPWNAPDDFGGFMTGGELGYPSNYNWDFGGGWGTADTAGGVEMAYPNVADSGGGGGWFSSFFT